MTEIMITILNELYFGSFILDHNHVVLVTETLQFISFHTIWSAIMKLNFQWSFPLKIVFGSSEKILMSF